MRINLICILSFIICFIYVSIDVNAAINPGGNISQEMCLCDNGMSGLVSYRVMETKACDCSGYAELVSTICGCDRRVISSSWDYSGCVNYTRVNTTLGSCSGEYALGNSQNYNLTCYGSVRSSGTDYDECYKRYQESASYTSLASGYIGGTATRTCTKYYYKSATCDSYNYSSCEGKCQKDTIIYKANVLGCDHETSTCCASGVWSGFEKKCPTSADCSSSQCFNSANGTCEDKPSSCSVSGGHCTYYCSLGWQKNVICAEGCTYNILKDKCLNSSGKPFCLFSRCDFVEADACTSCGWSWNPVQCVCKCAGIWNGSVCTSSSSGQIICK